MDFVKTLQSLEEAIYEIVTWVLFLPKTFIKVLIRPDWIQGYVSAEFEKESNNRFQGYLSPVLFWLIVAVLPYTMASVRIEINGSGLAVGDLNSAVLPFITVLMMTIPAWFAFVMLKWQKLPLEREPLKRLLYLQCYPAAVFELLILPFAIRAALRSADPLLLTISQVGLNIGVFWFLLAEIFVFINELKVRWWEAVGIALLATGLSLVILILILTLYATLLLITGAVQLPSS